MPEVIGDLLERYTFGQQMRRAGVPKSMRSVAWQNEPEPLKTLAHNRAESCSSEGSIGLDASQKDLPQRTLRSNLAEVSKNYCPNLTDERIVLTLALLVTSNANDFPLPVDVGR